MSLLSPNLLPIKLPVHYRVSLRCGNMSRNLAPRNPWKCFRDQAEITPSALNASMIILNILNSSGDVGARSYHGVCRPEVLET